MNLIIDNQELQLNTEKWEGVVSRHTYGEVLRFGDTPVFGEIITATKMDMSLDNQYQQMKIENEPHIFMEINNEKIEMEVDNAY